MKKHRFNITKQLCSYKLLSPYGVTISTLEATLCD